MMLYSLETISKVGPQALMQLPVETGIFTLEEDFAFSGFQFLLAMLSGLAMAFAFQFLLTNLAVAFVASPGTPSGVEDDSDGLGDAVRSIETKLGFFVLLSATISLFAASFLAVKLSLVSSAVLGAIVGVVLWSIYFCVLVWLGSNAVGSLIGSFVSTATSGIQGMMGAATGAIGVNAAKNQAVSTAEEITAAVRRELTSGFDPDRIQTTLQSSLSNLQLPKLNLDTIGDQFERILGESDLKDIANSDFLKTINRQSFVDLISDRTDLSRQDINQLADRLESVWQTATSQSGQQDAALQLVDVLKSATPEDLNSEELTGKLNQLVKTVSSTVTPGGSLTNRALQFGFASLLGQVIKNTDLSDLDVEKIAGQLQQLRDNVQGQASKQASKLGQQVAKPSKPFSVIRADLENYLLFSPTWKLNRETVKKEFRDVIYDPQADPSAIRQELESIDRDYFIESLSSRNDFLPKQIEDLATYLEEIRNEVFSSVQKAESETQSQNLKGRVEDYLRSTGQEELNPDAIGHDFKALLEDPEAGLDALGQRLGQFDRNTLVSLLEQRQDFDSERANQIVDQLES
ncbi:MAG: MFS transporter, partial [Myxacorys chilensis ATA2-1-KO14]|nr:MFS transporter [Myxacorys chilensis ATA2-1-KO14]